MIASRIIIRVLMVSFTVATIQLPMIFVYLHSPPEKKRWATLLFALNNVSFLKFLILALKKIEKAWWMIFLTAPNFLITIYTVSKFTYLQGMGNSFIACLLTPATLQGFQLFYLLLIPFLKQSFSLYYTAVALPMIMLLLIACVVAAFLKCVSENSSLMLFTALTIFTTFMCVLYIAGRIMHLAKFGISSTRKYSLMAYVLKGTYYTIYSPIIIAWVYYSRDRFEDEPSAISLLLLLWTASGGIGWSVGFSLQYCGIVDRVKDWIRRLWFYPVSNEEALLINHDVFAFLEGFLLFSSRTSRIMNVENEVDIEDPQIEAEKKSLEMVSAGLYKGNSCSICMEEFMDDQTLVAVKGCGHAFHSNCLRDWAINRGLCPLCRSKIRNDLFSHEILSSPSVVQ